MELKDVKAEEEEPFTLSQEAKMLEKAIAASRAGGLRGGDECRAAEGEWCAGVHAA